MAAVAKDDDDDYDLEDDDDGLLDAEDGGNELARQRRLLASVAQQVSKQQHAQGGIDFDEMEDHDEIMR